ncbi:MAG TPA: porin [Rickettsiales bacterium]|nr:porin [Rickettsiales bacterium]
MKKALLLSAIMVSTPFQSATANEETAALRAQIKALEARLDALEKKETQKSVKASPAVSPSPFATTTTPPAVATSSTAYAAAPAANNASVAYESGKGLTITSPDRQSQLKVSGYFQFDGREFTGHDTPSNNPSQFFIRSARPIFEAKIFDKFSARLMLDFGNGQSTLMDAYGDYNASEAFNARIGKFKVPLGLERWQPEQNILFVERGLTTNLVPYRDNGIGVYGKLFSNVLEYNLAFTDGAPDQVNLSNGADDGKSVVGRLLVRPFAQTDIKALKGLGIGTAASYGTHDASLTSQDLTTGYVTPAQSKFFTYATSAYADGGQWRLNPQLTYYNGPFSLLGEYVLEQQKLASGNVRADLRNDAWQAIVTYVVTGEDASFSGVVPKHNFDPANGEWGAFELAGRVGKLQVDQAAFPVFASSSTSANEAQETTFGGNWYLNPAVKFNLDFAVTSFSGGAANNGDRPTERAILGRTQVKF